MLMRLIKKIRDITGLTNYGISKGLRERGIEITTQGIDSYEKPTARSMRLDVLDGLFDLCADAGYPEKKIRHLLKQQAEEIRDNK